MSNVNFQKSKPLDPHLFSAAQGVKSPLASEVGGTTGRVWAARVCRCPVWEEAMACPVTSAPAGSDTTINELLCAKTPASQGSAWSPCPGRFNKRATSGKGEDAGKGTGEGKDVAEDMVLKGDAPWQSGTLLRDCSHGQPTPGQGHPSGTSARL